MLLWFLKPEMMVGDFLLLLFLFGWLVGRFCFVLVWFWSEHIVGLKRKQNENSQSVSLYIYLEMLAL